MWSYALAERLKGRVTVNCVDPGTVTTKLLFAGWGDVSYAAMRADVSNPAQSIAEPGFCFSCF
jgi:NAD(P)-dependent dehydrogenase (short-subunit alcohol dehydrogenase family)